MSGAVIRLPLDASGLAPRMSMWSVRSMSGTAIVSEPPNISAEAICLGSWSTVLALKTLRVPSALTSTRVEQRREPWAVGLPR